MSVPLIRVEPGRLADVVHAAADALRAWNSGSLLTIKGSGGAQIVLQARSPEVAQEMEYAPKKPCAELSDDGLALLLAQAARWEDSNGEPIDPPERVVRAVRAALIMRWLDAVHEREVQRCIDREAQR